MDKEQQIYSALHHVPNHDRAIRLGVAVALYIEIGPSAEDMYYGWCNGASEPRSWRSMWKWASKQGHGWSAGTIFYHARANGWVPERLDRPKADRNEWRKKVEADRKQQALQQAANVQRVQQAARDTLESLPIVSADCPYVQRKALPVELLNKLGCRQSGEWLVVPARSLSGYEDFKFRVESEVLDLQRIAGDGKKLFLKDGTGHKGKALVIRGSRDWSVCEGFATGIADHILTGRSVLVGFTDSGSVDSAYALRRSRPDASIRYVMDNDKSQAGRVAADKVSVIVNEIAASRSVGEDVHDLAARLGLM